MKFVWKRTNTWIYCCYCHIISHINSNGRYVRYHFHRRLAFRHSASWWTDHCSAQIVSRIVTKGNKIQSEFMLPHCIVLSVVQMNYSGSGEAITEQSTRDMSLSNGRISSIFGFTCSPNSLGTRQCHLKSKIILNEHSVVAILSHIIAHHVHEYTKAKHNRRSTNWTNERKRNAKSAFTAINYRAQVVHVSF